MTSPQKAAADLFRGLHQHGLLLLPNAWDAGSRAAAGYRLRFSIS